ncbi:cysteine hydrolase family protein [Rathayibacter sp. VKM Ac-2754]|uniref:cysteine hydrolase family protein n=1 Tax=Rathayibacter sp. VKM Ac-2754 TaxID=2609251 RepID=UPI00135B6565|nr:cysteine hydrolase [Rathayibacter sp. VKM Ac-2754]MWV59690.1 isochorismatase family protein [Rathayibacter sp. VKM Ac-2754]
MTLLVAIDLQHVFADPESPWASGEFARAADGTRRLLPVFGERVVTTRFAAPAEPAGAWIPYYRDWPFALVPGSDRLYELVPGFEGHRTLTATTFGKWGPELEALLDGGPRELVLTGVSTDCCVLSTALAAADAGVHVRVVADACAGASETDHRRALDAMALYAPLITLTTVDEVLAGVQDRG